MLNPCFLEAGRPLFPKLAGAYFGRGRKTYLSGSAPGFWVGGGIIKAFAFGLPTIFILEPFGLAEGELLDGFAGTFGAFAGEIFLLVELCAAVRARFPLVLFAEPSIYLDGLKQIIVSLLR